MTRASLLLVLLFAACSSSHRTGRAGDAGILPGTDATVAADARPAEGDAGEPPVHAGDGGIVLPRDAGPARPDAGPPMAGTIACGATECDLATEGCLASCLYATDERMPACLPAGDDRWSPPGECPSGREQFPRYWLRCDGREDCAEGEWCHIQYGSLGQYAYCDRCDTDAGCDFVYFEPLCRTDADCPAEAPRCVPTDALPGYSACSAAAS